MYKANVFTNLGNITWCAQTSQTTSMFAFQIILRLEVFVIGSYYADCLVPMYHNLSELLYLALPHVKFKRRSTSVFIYDHGLSSTSMLLHMCHVCEI